MPEQLHSLHEEDSSKERNGNGHVTADGNGNGHPGKLLRVPFRVTRWRSGDRPVALVQEIPHRNRDEIPEAALPESSRRRDTTYRRLLGLADILSAAIAGFVGVQLLGDDTVSPLALVAIPMVLLVGKVTRLYDRDEHLVKKTTLDEAPELFRVATLYTLLAWLSATLVVNGYLGSVQVLALWGLLFGLMLVTRSAARAVARTVSTEERCLVLGDAEAAHWMADKLQSTGGVRAVIVGRVPLEPDHPGTNGIPVLGDFERLGLVLAEQDIDRVIIAPATSLSDHILDAIRLVKALGVKVSVLPRLFEVVGSSVEFDEIDGMMLLGVRRYGLTQSSAALKRCLDITGAGLGLLVLAPLFLVVAVAIKLDTKGPVLFRQRRMGCRNKPFEMLKFRTMVDGAEAQKHALAHRNEAGAGLFKIDGDPRITRVGAILRSTSLDELPQLINVLRGEMALVGPRPLVIDEDAHIEGWQRRRLLLPPGMTGLWQVFGSARIPLPEMVKIDYLYGANWSLWLDIKILLRTVPFVLGRRGL
ncbi:MAG TPA: sugar transferase [Thermoleophilaceae bacterium]|nr:sugar transferase [Thermoleophilaceae bacterium]